MAKDASSHRMPAGLIKNGRGQRLWHDITAKWELTESEYRTLENACYTAEGSQGQLVVHPLLPELRRDETHLADLLKRIDMPEPEEQSEDASSDGGRSSQMRATVNRRWHDSKWEKAYG